MRRFITSIYGWELILCLLGIIVAAVPILPRTNSFWGIEAGGETSLSPGYVINDIAKGSPAEAAGLVTGDRVLAVDNEPLEFGTFDRELSKIEPSQQRSLTVKRGEKETTLIATGRRAEVEAIIYNNWQLVWGLILVALAMLLFVTQPLRLRWWRPTIVVVAGSALALIAIVAPMWHWGHTRIRQYWLVDNVPTAAWQEVVCTVIGGSLVVLGLFQLRSVVRKAV